MNDEEFRSFYRNYFEFSTRIAKGIVKSRATAEDVSQEVFYYFYRIMERLDAKNEKKLHSLVITETTNKARDYLRRAHVKREVTSLDDTEEGVNEKWAESAEAMLLGIEQREYVRMVLEKLRIKNKMNYEIFMKITFMGETPEMVSEEYGITRNNVNNRVLRTRLWLKEELKRMY